jgi:hypothetical protein
LSKEGGCCSGSQLCFTIGDFDCNYSPWRNEKRRKRVNALLTEKRGSMYIDGSWESGKLLEGAIWRACQMGAKEVNPPTA